MRCETCGNEVVVYELYPRSYRLYIYLCKKCTKGFLAHHFDLNLEIYQMDNLQMKKNGDIVFITGLKAEPRVYDFKVSKDVDSIIVADDEIALGELAITEEPIFEPYSEKAMKRLHRLLNLAPNIDKTLITKKILEKWRAAK
jgi:hypothetical protein